MKRLAHLLVSSALLAAAGPGLAACGEDTPPAVCADADAVRSSVKALGDVQLQPGALEDLTQQLQAVADDVTTLAEDASKEYADEVGGVKDAVKALTTGLEAAASNPTAATITALQPLVAAIGSSFTALSDAVEKSC